MKKTGKTFDYDFAKTEPPHLVDTPMPVVLEAETTREGASDSEGGMTKLVISQMK